MSGRKIHDYAGHPHTADELMRSKNYMKEMKMGEGDGHVGMEYPDTEEMIRRDQDKGVAKMKGHPLKPGYRH